MNDKGGVQLPPPRRNEVIPPLQGNKNARQALTKKVFVEDEPDVAIGSYMPAKHNIHGHQQLSINQQSLALKDQPPQVLTPTKTPSI